MRIPGSGDAPRISSLRPPERKDRAPASQPSGRVVRDSFERSRTTPFGATATLGKGGAAMRAAILKGPSAVMAAAPRGQVTEAQVMEALRSGRTDDATRQMIAEYFVPLGMEASHETMESIRQEGLLGVFIQATVRDDAGSPPGPELTAGLTRLLETGRLDVYAETLASTPINVGDYGVLEYRPGENAVVLDESALGDTQNLANILAHELFHAFADAHGGGHGAINEGFGIAAREYAFTDGQYSLAEMVYGTKNFYRDRMDPPQPDYPLGDMRDADPELQAFLEALGARDSSLLAWQNPPQMEREYDEYFAPLDRSDENAWPAAVEEATQRMLEARGENRVPEPEPQPTNPLEAIIDWFKRLLGL